MSSRRKCLHKLVVALVYRKHVSSPLLIYLLNHLFVAAWTYGQLVCTWVTAYTTLPIVALKWLQFWPLGALSGQLCCILLFLNTTFWHCQMHQVLLCISCHSTAVSHCFTASWFLVQENGVRNQNLGAGCEVLLLLGQTLGTGLGKICMQANPRSHTDL